MGVRRLPLFLAVLCFTAVHGQAPLQPSTCRSNQFQCANKRCIPAGWVCDDDYDCNSGDGDNSDETDCPDKTCGPEQFACLDGLTCITNGWRCDGEEDCTDGSDESPEFCPDVTKYKCPANHYRCVQQCTDESSPCQETCVHLDKLCDNHKDCPSGDDEGPHCTSFPTVCANGRGDCEEACTVSREGRVCFCRNGYIVGEDNKCTDLNECEIPGFCDQMCVNTNGSFTCSCADGYALQADKTSCKAQDSDSAVLVIANRQRLGMLNWNGTGTSLKELPTSGAMALDISVADQNICWIQVEDDLSKSRLRCVPKNNFTQAAVQVQKLTSSVHHAEQMAYDWLTGNLYFTDDEADRVFVCNRQGSVCVTLIEDRIANPRGIALDPTRGLMFLSDYGSSPRIEKAFMDGTGRIQIVTSKIVLPHGIALDIVTQTLYWVDAYLNYIESVDYNGQNRRTIAQGPKVEHLYGITVFEQYLYATDWHEDTIIQVDRWNSSKPIATIAPDFNHAGAIKVYHPAVQPITDHACKSNPCQDICLLAGSKDTKTCRCRPGFTLETEDGTCQPSVDDTFLIYSKSRPGVIKGISLQPEDYSDKMVPIEHLDNPRAFDFHAAESYVYFSDPTQFRIGRQKITGEGHQILVNSSLNNCEGVAVDWIGGNLYWTDDGLNTISVSRLNGSQRKTLITGDMTHPRSIVVDPTSGMMYWSDWVDDITDERFAKIEQAWMDGTNREDLINRNSTTILWPNGLALDHPNKKLYWADAFYDKIMVVDLVKRETWNVYNGEVLIHPFGLALYQNYLYWTEFRTGEIKRLDLSKNNTVTHIKSDQAPLFEVRVYSKSLQTGTNACAQDNNGCASLCLITPDNKAVCDCPDGEEIMDDGKNCEAIANYTSSPQCGASEFACNSGQCVPARWKCDGDRDCHDGSDEMASACTGHTCQPNQFRCNSSRCIPDRWVCDGDKDCGETGEDETGCDERTCGPGQFHCNSSRCIPEMWVCDRDNDCGDGSDEPSSCAHPSCDPTQFQCDNGRCISPSWRCDTDNDCTDNSDEKDCTYSCNNETQHKCLDTGRCISVRWRCDGDFDCQDHSDEIGCDSTNPPAACDADEFQCHSGQCILARWRCDKDLDCMDKSDEFNCTGSERPCDPENEFQCVTSGECISLDWRCDQEEDCEDKSDERDCKTTCELPSRHCTNDTSICLSPDKFCNKKQDCPDGSDEGRLCDILDCDINNGGCSHTCQPWPNGVLCLCPEELRLSADNKTCEEVNWCQQLGICSQICTPVGKSYRCECQAGWVLEPDEYTCRSTDPATPYIVFSNRHELRRIDLSSKDFQYRVLVPGLRNTIAVDYDLSTNSLFWTDVVEDKIFKGNMSSTGGISSIRPVVQTGLATAEGLAVDWVGKNMYWVESNLDQIEVARLNGMYRTTLIAEQMESPRAIALDPRVGYLFWTDWESNRARIERCDMSGTNRSVIHWVASDGGWPNGLTVDYLDNRIFWVDAKSDSITSANYDGGGVRKVLWGHRHLSHPFSISLFAEKVFWTDWRTNMLASANKYTGGNFTILQRTSTQPFDLQVVHPTRQPRVNHSCADNRWNDCSHLCLLGFNGTYACRCPQRYKLKADNKTCELDGKFLLYARQLEVRGVDLLKPYYNMMSALTLPHIGNVTAVDFDAQEERIYWVDLRFPALRRAFLNGSNVETLVTSQDLTNTVGLAVDWLSRNLYWTVNYGDKKSIMVSKLDGTFKKPLVTALTSPGYLAVHPSEGVMFWSDGGDLSYIAKSNLDGTDEHQLIGNVSTLSLTLDHVGKRLYWINGNKTISSCDLDGNNVQTIAGAVQQNMSRPHALAVGGNLLYWGDHASEQIMVASKADGSGLKVFRSNTPKVMDIKIFDAQVQTRTGGGGTNPCSTNNGGCQQLCLPNATGRSCQCTAGYELLSDNMKCKGLDEFILYSVHEEIRGIQLTPQETTDDISDALSPIRGSALAVAIDFLAENDTIYWADTAMKSIHVSNRNQTWQGSVVTTDMGRVEGLAVDWVAKNIYWTDQQFDLIEVARWNGSFRHVIVSTGLDKPRDIVVHPTLGYIFWSDWGDNQKIERASMDGSQRFLLYNSSGLQWPNGMTIDYATDMLYWVDANSNSIERIGVNGDNHQYILTSENQDLFAISLYGDNIYWTDRTHKSGVIIMGNKNNATNATVLRDQLGIQLKDITVFSQQRQNGTNICGPHKGADGTIVENGGCEQLCLYVGNNKRKCRCGHGMLADDGTSCKPHDAYLLYSERISLKSSHILDSKNRPIETIQLKDNMRNVIGLAFDYGNGTNKRIFYSDIHHGNIQSVYEDGTGQKIIVSNVGSVEGLAYHRGNDELFWTSYTDSNIRRFSLNQTKPNARNETIVVLAQEDHPRAIVLDECQGRIWWTNWNDRSPSIMTSYIGGQELKSIVQGSDIRTPNGLAVDHAAEKLYWSDATLDKIERCNYDGSKRVVILQVEPVHSFGLAVYGDYIYWTDWVRRSVMRANKLDGSNVRVLRSDISQQPMGIIAVANETNNCMLSPCRTLNGGCDDECSVLPTGVVNCTCHPGKQLYDSTRCIMPEVTCSPKQFGCTEKGCVPYEDSCDGVPDCEDGSDEASPYCETRDCRQGYVRCRNGRCVPLALFCNGRNDCHDNSDEDRCGVRSCAPGEFRCNNGRCIDESLRCDQRVFCDDASDEIGCPPVDCSTYRERGLEEVLSGYVNCNRTSLCILPQWRCDGENDCGDNSDEENCEAGSCGSNYFQCRNGRCIPSTWKCDNDNDCGDNSDEPASCSFSCTDEQFACNNSRCIPVRWKCDGEQDCEDGSDESENLQCDRITCAPEQFRCVENARCIPKHWTCDGDNDCPDASDEMGSANCTFTETCDSDEFQCQNRRCIQAAWVCDHDDDCGDGSDEVECRNTTCAPDQFQCNNGRCIPSTWTCDKDNDCNDNSDESLQTCAHTCSDGEFMCKSEDRKCIPWNKTCDTNKDCDDFSDEPADLCGKNECMDADLNNCSQVCEDLNIGYRCVCHKGFRMNGSVCEDVDECTTEFPCSQYCINTYGSYRCRCAEGYSRDPAHPGACKAASDVKPYVMFSNRYYIRKVDFAGMSYEIVLGGLSNAVALDFDVEEDRIYWTDVTTQRSMIRRAYLNGSNFEVLHSTALSNPDGIAVDWVGRNLYWCDKAKDVIEVSKLNGNYRKVLYSQGLKEPRALVVEPHGGFLYWSDWGENPHIGRAWLDGSHGKVIVNSTNTKMGWPNGLTVDYITKRIFWGDAREDHIQFAEADGSNIHTVMRESGIPHIFALTLFEDYIFWTDWETKGVHKAHKYTGANATQLVTSVHRPMDIHVFHPYRQKSIPNHPCSVNNGGCGNLCLLQPGGKRTCACAENFYLASDGKTCLSNCTSSQFECSNFKCIPFWWKCDTENDCDDGSDEPESCPPFVCRPGQFQCENSECTNPAFICDGDKDCSDGSDEKNCEHHTCLPNQFKCKGESKCIPGIFRCNGASNCQDGSDEENCPERTCAANQFKCNSSKICIPRVWMCDGDNDCGDNSDEPSNCTARSCSENELRCNNTGRCIPSRWQCDGDNDCGDGSDEQVGVCSARTCDQYQHRCTNNKCIPLRWRCDYDDDCGDNSDEEGCTPRPCSESEFQCEKDNRCIPGRWKCDGDYDCEDGSDEHGCSTTCQPNQFKCENGHCIPQSWHCDRDRDCLDGSDEENCEVTVLPGNMCNKEEFQCNNTLCKPLSWKCDGEDDCGDNSDEEAFMCKNFVCPPTRQFRCRNDRVCLPITRRCDGFSHCDDNSDEMDCRAPAENRTCTTEDFKCLTSNKCVKLDLVCNNYDNCGDGSDEGLCGPAGVNECETNNGNCQHICTDLPRGHYCKCRDGFTLGTDLTSCQDIDECADFGRCSQICNNTKGSYHCSCSAGFMKARLRNGVETCIAQGEPDYLLIADDNAIKRINPDDSHGGYGDGFRGNDETRVESMDIDVRSNTAFWSNIHTSSIYMATIRLGDGRSKRQATNVEKLEIRGLEEPRGIAIDWVGRHLYWTDARRDVLEVANLDGSNRKTLLNTGMDRPHSVAVDPKNGYVFWTDWGLSPKIERARLDGLERKVLVRQDLQWPTGLAIDYQNGRLYWADAKKNTIESIDFDGNGRVVAANYSKGLNQPYLIDLFEDNIYGTTYKTGEVFKVDKFGRDNVTVLARSLQHASDVVIFQQYKQDQTITNPCSSSNCTHLCFRAPRPGGIVCACPEGGRLDGNTCTNLPTPSPDPTQKACEEAALVCWNGGTCIVNEQGTAKCKCSPNFYGDNCRQNKCFKYCKNNGRCEVNNAGQPVCKCVNDFFGPRCNSSCENYCQNGGTCSISSSKDGVCACPSQYEGELCETDRCDQCKNGATCSVHVNGTVTCVSPTTACDTWFCSNGGACDIDKLTNKAHCKCPENFHGPHCNEAKDYCYDFCQNGGTCSLDSDGNPVCGCADGFVGEQCTETVSSKGKQEGQGGDSGTAAAIAVPVVLALLIIAVIVGVCFYRKRSSRTMFQHKRMTNNVEIGNPTFLYDQEEDDETEQLDPSLTLDPDKTVSPVPCALPGPQKVEDDKYRLEFLPTNFSNPVYDCLYNEASGSSNSLTSSDEKKGLLSQSGVQLFEDQNDPFGGSSVA